MVSKDQAIGGAILIVCILVAAVYTFVIAMPNQFIDLFKLTTFAYYIRLYAVVVPVYIAFIAIMVIGAWIGWTMATTPPPKPIEEITTEIEDKKGKAVAPAEENIK
jgi:predicted DNA-binding transcriptional regulator